MTCSACAINLFRRLDSDKSGIIEPEAQRNLDEGYRKGQAQLEHAKADTEREYSKLKEELERAKIHLEMEKAYQQAAEAELARGYEA